MAAGFITEVKAKIDATLQSVVLGAVAASAAVTAFFFLCVAIFIWTEQNYGTITAALVIAVLFIVIAAAALTILAVRRRRAVERAVERARQRPKPGTTNWWLDPAVVASGLQIGKALGPKRVVSLAVLGALAAGVLLTYSSTKR